MQLVAHISVQLYSQSILGVAFQAVGRNLGKCLTRQFLSEGFEAA
jgi:hypothetical protein